MAKRNGTSQQVVTLGKSGWKGVRDVIDAGGQSSEFLQDAVNSYFPDPKNGGAVPARPGFQKLTTTGLESNSAIQGVFPAANGLARYTFVFVNGKVYRQSAAAAWTDVTPVGVTIDASAERIYAINYNGEMIVNDGVNEPWRGTALTSTPITGTEIEVNAAGDAWVARGKPTVHGGKLFFIVQSISATTYYSRLVWSEEGDATLGYLQTDYTNFWDLIQSPTAAEIIWAIQGTNSGLYYFRQHAIGVILGAVNADFTTASTHDGVSNSDGISTVNADICFARDYIWFIDRGHRPCRIRLGSRQIEPVWQQMRHRLARIRGFGSSSVANLNHQHIAYSEDLGKVVMLFAPDGAASSAGSTHLYVFDADTGNYEGRWSLELAAQPASEDQTAVFAAIVAAAPRSDFMTARGAATLIVAGPDASNSQGHVWQQTALVMSGSDSVSFGDSGAAMHQSITTMLTPDEQNVEVRVDQVAVETVPDTTAVTLDHYTPYGSVTGITMSGTASNDSIQSSYDHGIQRAGLASNLGRWHRFVFHKNVASGATRHAFEKASLRIKIFLAGPRAP